MAYALNEAGKFRANPLANAENAVRAVDRTSPGTAGTDSGTVDLNGAVQIQGIKYIGKDGAERFVPFSREDQLTQARVPYTLSPQAEAPDIQAAVHELINREEVMSVVTVTRSGSTLTIQHTGSGTLSALVVDGIDQPLSRVSVAGVGAVAAAGDIDATPAAMKAAEENNVDLNDIEGSGADGKVIKADIPQD
jgi:pyruvate/2-oxoglutarate dehydrogenase complex dihydrolipoamide acyltransferase (E2) component